MIVEVEGKQIECNLVIFDSVSFQAWAKEDGKMVVNITANNIKRIIIEGNDEKYDRIK